MTQERGVGDRAVSGSAQRGNGIPIPPLPGEPEHPAPVSEAHLANLLALNDWFEVALTDRPEEW